MAQPAERTPEPAPAPAPADAALSPAQLAARLRAGTGGGFTGRAPLVAVDGSFRAARLDQPDRAAPAPAPVLPELLPPDDAAPPPPDPAQLLAEARAEGHAAGLTEGMARGIERGRAEGRAAADADLAAARDAFLAVARGLAAAPDGLPALADMIAAAVRQLAAQRAGQAIDALPLPFLARIEALADRVAQGMRDVTLRLNPDDLAAIAPHLGDSALAGTTILPDPRLARGDAEVRADGIVLSDLLDTR
ncbi:MAG: hypothetical protein RIR62_1074 [Pseudomonadota bacterium]|jgi:flagellar assembly protein FliH